MPPPSDTDPDPQRFRELMLADEPTFEDLLACVFGVTNSVAEVYRQVLENEDCTAKELAHQMDYDKSSVNRKLKTLLEQGLVTRHRDLLSVGGYAYRYNSVPIDEVQTLMHETLDEWSAFMHQQIQMVDDTLEASS